MKITQTDSFCKHNFVYFQIFVLLLSALSVLCGETTAQDFKTVRDGIEYAEVTREIDKQPVRMNLLRLDLTKVRLDVAHAMDAAIGTEKTSSIATRHRAIAAINAGFFRLDTSIFAGDPAGVLMINHKLLSESRDSRVAIAITNGLEKTDVKFGHLDLRPMVKDDKYTTIEVKGINRQRNKDEVVVYTPEFGRTTLTEPSGVELIVRNGKVTAISKNGSSFIPPDGFVLSGDGEAGDGLLERWRVGSRIWLSTSHPISMYDFAPDIQRERARTERLLTIDPKLIASIEDVTNGVPQLIKNGKIDITWEEEKSTKSFVETRHPRTAVAKLKDGKFLMITVDGRSESSGGIGLYDLAALLLEFGATDAMNLDGGGSTTMFLDGKVVNHPSDKEGERKVSDAILVFLREKSAAMPKPARW
jgi:exopolysaccharide biosynthesis protein